MITISFKSFTLLPNGSQLNCSVAGGQIVLVTSNNSASTWLFLLTMCGCYANYTGDIIVNDYPLRHNILQMRESVQLVPSSGTMYPKITPKRQLSMLSLRWSGIDISPAAIRTLGLEQICQAGSFAELTNSQKKIFELSALAACPAPIWLLDGPDENLDSDGLKSLRGLIEHRISKGGIVFLTNIGDKLSDLTMSAICV